MKKKITILVTNDDGVNSPGLFALIDMVRDYGNLIVVAPDTPNSGKSSSLTVENPIRLNKLKKEKDLMIYSCSGTPADCVKLALNHLFKDEYPSFVVSGINHGSNASINAMYSGTVGAALEGCVNGIPSIAYSITSHEEKIDFSNAIKFGRLIFNRVLENGLPDNICLNVNFPVGEIKDIIPCRQSIGHWKEEFEHRTDPNGREYFWLTGYFSNSEPASKDTDIAFLNDGYATIVPTKTDFTDFETISRLKTWNYEI